MNSIRPWILLEDAGKLPIPVLGVAWVRLQWFDHYHSDLIKYLNCGSPFPETPVLGMNVLQEQNIQFSFCRTSLGNRNRIPVVVEWNLNPNAEIFLVMQSGSSMTSTGLLLLQIMLLYAM